MCVWAKRKKITFVFFSYFYKQNWFKKMYMEEKYRNYIDTIINIWFLNKYGSEVGRIRYIRIFIMVHNNYWNQDLKNNKANINKMQFKSKKRIFINIAAYKLYTTRAKHFSANCFQYFYPVLLSGRSYPVLFYFWK